MHRPAGTRSSLGLAAIAWISGFVLSADAARAAGVTTHSETANRAAKWFISSVDASARGWILANPDALQAGGAFPDWGYAFGHGDAAEDTHWPPFHEAAGDYVHETYPQPWDSETQKLATFLLGIRSHWIADLDWHGLGGVQEGLIDVSAAQEFNGSFGDAHSNADTGGDWMASYELALDWMDTPWYVPINDLLPIYERIGYTDITSSELTLDTGLMMLAQRATKLGGALLLGSYIQKSPFLGDQYQDYFVGGVDDLAIQTAFNWDPLIYWMQNGTAAAGPSSALAPIPSFLETKIGDDHHAETSSILAGLPAPASARRPSNLRELAKLGVSVQETARGAYFTPTTRTAASSDPSPQSAVPPLGEGDSLTITAAEPNAYLGTSLAVGDLNRDGKDDLVIGSPGYNVVGGPQIGRVRVIYGHSVSGDQQLDVTGGGADVTLTGDVAFGRFGWAVAVVDLNADGLPDLAISQPTTEAQSYGYHGRVLVYFGQAGGGISASPDVTITTSDTYANLGYKLLGADLDGDDHRDLVIATPYARAGGRQRGLVAVFRGSASFTSGTSRDVSSADWSVTGSQDWSWLGFEVTASVGGPYDFHLFVGAPKYKNGATQGTGRVYGYDLAGLATHTASTTPVFTITGSDEFDNIGTALAYGDPRGDGHKQLAISAPTDSPNATAQTGSVSLVAVEGLSGDVSLSSLPILTRIDGDTSWARLGARLGFVDVNGDLADELWVTEPMRPSNLTTWESGAAYLFAGGASFPTGQVVAGPNTALWSMRDTLLRGLFGSAIAFPDFDGDVQRDFAIASRRASVAEGEAGMVRVVMAPHPEVTNVQPSQLGVGTARNFIVDGSHFHAGVTLELRPNTGGPTIVPIVTSTTATQIRATVSVPADAPFGAYMLQVRDPFRGTSVAGAVAVTPDAGPVVCGVSRFGAAPSSAAAIAALALWCVPLGAVAAMRRSRRQRTRHPMAT